MTEKQSIQFIETLNWWQTITRILIKHMQDNNYPKKEIKQLQLTLTFTENLQNSIQCQ